MKVLSLFKNRLSPENDKGQKHGLEIDYYDDDQLKVRMVRRWVNGKREGKAVWLFDDGAIAHLDSFKDNMRHGISREFVGLGEGEHEPRVAITYRNGKQFGESITY